MKLSSAQPFPPGEDPRKTDVENARDRLAAAGLLDDFHATFTGGYGPSPVIGDYPEIPWGWILLGVLALVLTAKE